MLPFAFFSCALLLVGILIVLIILFFFIAHEFKAFIKEDMELMDQFAKHKTSLEDYIANKSIRSSTQDNKPVLNLNIPRLNRHEGVHLKFNNLGLRLKSTGKQVLKGVTGEFKPRRLTAIMGPSGSGKSTFLNTLSGRATYGVKTGSTKINGKEDDVRRYKKLVGFVPQEDVMNTELTVKEVLGYSAEARLPASLSSEQKEGVVEDILSILDLQELKYQYIGDVVKRGISGGQRKRVNIGMELVSDPMILFLDEPTSGLDSTSAMETIGVLKDLSRGGMTVVAVIHQPRYEIFNLFDDVVLLGKGGRTVYLGPTDDVAEYFENLGYKCPPFINPADFYLDVIGGEVEQKEEKYTLGDEDDEESDIFGDNVSTTTSNVDRGKNKQSDYLHDQWCRHQESSSSSDEEEDSTSESFTPVFDQVGSKINFATYLVMSFLVPWATLYPYYFDEDTIMSAYGSLTGAMLSVSAMALIGMSVSSEVNVKVFAGIILGWALLTLFVLVLRLLFQSTRESKPRFLGLFVSGVLCGPFSLILVVVTKSIKRRSVLFGSFIFQLGTVGGFWYPVTASKHDFPTWSHATVAVILITCCCIVWVFFWRYESYPHLVRKTPWFFFQVYVNLERSIVQQVRFWPAILFDLGLMFAVGIFMGIMFYDRKYRGPILSGFGIGTSTVPCPAELMDIFPPACFLYRVPLDDPIPSVASLTTLAVSLGAITSSIRVFGNEEAVFMREHQVGCSTEAYYIGKSLGHLPLITIAPLIFWYSFAALAPIEGSWTEHYALLMLVYFTASGIAYFVSLIVPKSLAQLCGVMTVLSLMTFSGANPTLKLLKENKLLPNILFYPSYASYLRWAQEMHYLIEAKNIAGTEGPMELIYGYYPSDALDCWIWLLCIATIFRVFAYTALVTKEK